MSDPVTHAEIEDVLSSIRRLVSEDGHPPEAAGKPAGRLVLTPALRVRERPPQPAGTGPDSADAGGDGGGAVAGSADDRAEDRAEARAEALSGPDCLQLKSGDVISVSRAWAEAGAGPKPEAPAGAGGSAGDQGQMRAVPEQDGPAAAADPEAPWSNPRATLFAAATRINENADTAGRRAASVVQKIAELEAKVAQAPGDWEPDGIPQDVLSGPGRTAIAWQDDDPDPDAGAEPEASAAAVQEPGADRETGSGMDKDIAEAALTDTALENLPPEAAYHDEDSLRELVSAIVREELQGALGERITRNIRKLVRREIHRVLATQDLL